MRCRFEALGQTCECRRSKAVRPSCGRVKPVRRFGAGVFGRARWLAGRRSSPPRKLKTAPTSARRGGGRRPWRFSSGLAGLTGSKESARARSFQFQNGKAPVQRGLKPGPSWNAPMGLIAGTGTEHHTTEIVPAGSRAGYPTKPFFRGHEIRLKRRCSRMVCGFRRSRPGVPI